MSSHRTAPSLRRTPQRWKDVLMLHLYSCFCTYVAGLEVKKHRKATVFKNSDSVSKSRSDRGDDAARTQAREYGDITELKQSPGLHLLLQAEIWTECWCEDTLWWMGPKPNILKNSFIKRI